MQPETGRDKTAMKYKVTQLLIIVTCLLGLSVAQAEEVWYQVELIVFENLQADADGEAWPVTPGYPDIDSALDILSSEMTLQAEPIVKAETEVNLTAPGWDTPAEVQKPEPPVTYQQLSADKLRIADVFSRMRRSANYRPLLHLGWIQSGAEETVSQAVRVALNSEEDPTSITNQQILDGFVKMRKSRFIHIEADLVYFLPQTAFMETSKHGYASLVRLQESRKMRLNELHYLDHPLFGVVLYVSPLQPEE